MTMFIAYISLTVLLSFALVFSGRSMLVKEPDITETLTRLGVPHSWFPILAILKIAGALGLLAGIAYRPLGIAAGVGLVLFFVGAVVSHLRVNDVKGTPVPTVLVLASMTPVVLGLATL
ncbi:DoxX family protein [Actinobacteria bacterium YIM 96077]|uniref:DoxX family protein n=1 Tax=Phytoactinopolyspora halophila TaxID=1981511 RepID=A0A329QXG2_9ACTN|nr:DoxX family protein [Phytoactinopolyspora halophila]AYY12808.1 DoxX family protein [Actinobacteria bacterium YIM 96077]RAW16399.1 DoxX family protein [Phytoactinopolyspora halophila]